MLIAPIGDPLRLTASIIHNKHVKKINFTGSTAVGRIIAKEAGAALKPLLLELGGKAAALVTEDADLEKAAKLSLEGAFINAGQVCEFFFERWKFSRRIWTNENRHVNREGNCSAEGLRRICREDV